ncbi:MAG: hypothetical protein KME42_14230 [Tildeniella nuda ZEHNDER 1965/U140]|jgi:hypothetical protein|nr:hypothetical protein [Tildeniella nuda ZEHNDER 1965/U140]
MPITQLALKPDLTIGNDPAVYAFDLVINGEVVATAQPTTVIKVGVKAIGQTALLVPATTATLTPGNPTIGKWTVSFSNTTTLLQDPANLGSAMLKELLKYPDDRADDVTGLPTGFCKALVELQIGAPYNKRTEQALIYIGKGLIA